jgi:hypothetical protein
LEVSGNDVSLMLSDGGAGHGTAARTGDTLRLALDSGLVFDIDRDGVDDPGSTQLRMVRRRACDVLPTNPGCSGRGE